MSGRHYLPERNRSYTPGAVVLDNGPTRQGRVVAAPVAPSEGAWVAPDYGLPFGGGSAQPLGYGTLEPEAFPGGAEALAERVMTNAADYYGGFDYGAGVELSRDQAYDALAGYAAVPGSGGGTVVDSAAVAAQRSYVNGELELALQRIGEQFAGLRDTIDQRRIDAEGSIAEARESALSSLLGLRSDLDARTAEASAGQAASTSDAVGQIGEIGEGLLADLEAQGVDSSELVARLAEQQGRVVAQGDRQASLLNRLAEVSSGAQDRLEGRSATIAQGAQSNLAVQVQDALSQAAQAQADQEFQVSESARQQLLELALNPPTRRVGGTAGRDGLDRFQMEQAAILIGQGYDPQMAAVLAQAGEFDNIAREERQAARDAAADAPEAPSAISQFFGAPGADGATIAESVLADWQNHERWVVEAAIEAAQGR